MHEAAQSDRPDDLVIPSAIGDDTQLLWSLGIPVYKDGRVEAERVAKVYRDAIYPAVSHLREENLKLKMSSGVEIQLMQRVAELMTHVQGAGERLDQRERQQVEMAEALASKERSALHRIERLSTDIGRCESLLGQSRDLLAKAQHLDEMSRRLEVLVEKGEKLTSTMLSVSHEAENTAEMYERARKMFNLALEAENETRRMAEDASRRLRSALEMALENLASAQAARLAASTAGVPPELASVSVKEKAPPEPAAGVNVGQEAVEDERDLEGDDSLEAVKLVKFVSEILLPASRFQVKRRLIEVLGGDRVADAPNGRDLLISCERDETEYIVAAALEAAVELGVEIQIVDAAPDLVLAASLEAEGHETQYRAEAPYA